MEHGWIPVPQGAFRYVNVLHAIRRTKYRGVFLTQQYTNLADFCQRMREKYSPDWDQGLNNDAAFDSDSNQAISWNLKEP